jgi:hypothetical protein
MLKTIKGLSGWRHKNYRTIWRTPKLFDGLVTSPKEKGKKVGARSLAHRGACWNSRMRTRKINKQLNYSHGPAQTKQQVGWCIVKALLVQGRAMGKHEFTRFTTAWTWEKPPPSPLIVYYVLGHEPTPKCHFVPGLPNGSLKIAKSGTPMTLCANL